MNAPMIKGESGPGATKDNYMRLDPLVAKEVQVPCLPFDCQPWLGQRELLRLCLEAVPTLDWDHPPLSIASCNPHRPQMLMTLLTYCYARGLYASADIVAALPMDWTLQYICAHDFPEERSLARFRRNHREPLVRCLNHVLQQAVRMAGNQVGNSPCPPHRFIRAVRRSARHRVEAAALMDSLGTD